MALARWVLPVPVPPTSTMLRRFARKAAVQGPHQPLVTGVSSNTKTSRSLTAGNLAAAIR